jgi:DNA polymerase-4
MPMAAAIRLCPQAIVVKPRMERYAEISRQVFEILEQFTPLVEPISVDEAFLDVTGCERLLGSAEHIARNLKDRVRSEIRLTASVGVAPNKFLAKLASDLQKPDGLVVVKEADVQSFLAPLPISRLWGVGKATLPEFERLDVHTFGNALSLSLGTLRQHFGETGEQFFQLVRGIDDRPVLPDREAKSISHEVTFPADTADGEHLRSVILEQIEHVTRRLRHHNLVARTVTLKIRYGDFSTITRRETLPAATDQTDALWNVAVQLLEAWQQTHPRAVRLIGVGVSQLSSTKECQLSLFEPTEASTHDRLDTTMDAIRDRFGEQAIGRAAATRDQTNEREST